jgi:Cu(I)/Ag(I) efflux system protein CusF
MTIFRLIIVILLLTTLLSCNTRLASKDSPVEKATGPAAATQTTTHHAVGTVKALDTKASTIEIDHGDIEGLMPAMQMEFSVKNAAVLNGISVGDRVEFEVTNGVGGMQVTDIKKFGT